MVSLFFLLSLNKFVHGGWGMNVQHLTIRPCINASDYTP